MRREGKGGLGGVLVPCILPILQEGLTGETTSRYLKERLDKRWVIKKSRGAGPEKTSSRRDGKSSGHSGKRVKNRNKKNGGLIIIK